MNSSHSRTRGAFLLALVALNGMALWPDVANSRIDLNDNVSHFALIERIVSGPGPR